MPKSVAAIIGWAYLSLITVHTLAYEPSHNKLLIVRGDGNWPPFEYVEDGELKGLHIDLIYAVAAEMQLEKPEFFSAPWPRALHMIASGQVDAITYLPRNLSREEFIYFNESNILSRGTMAFFTRKPLAEKLNYDGDYKALDGYPIGVVRGYYYSDKFSNSKVLHILKSASNEEQLIKQFKASRFPIAAADIIAIKHWAKRLNLNESVVFLKPYIAESRAHYLGFSRKRNRQTISVRFGKAMEAYKASPQYISLLESYDIAP